MSVCPRSVDVGAGNYRCGYFIEPSLSGEFAFEVPGVFLAVGVSVAGTPFATSALLDVGHRASIHGLRR